MSPGRLYKRITQMWEEQRDGVLLHYPLGALLEMVGMVPEGLRGPSTVQPCSVHGTLCIRPVEGKPFTVWILPGRLKNSCCHTWCRFFRMSYSRCSWWYFLAIHSMLSTRVDHANMPASWPVFAGSKYSMNSGENKIVCGVRKSDLREPSVCCWGLKLENDGLQL